jgi:pyruvate formate lyase activating enzyme
VKTALCTFLPKESTVDFEGHIARVFFTQGCNFRCGFCHNPELIPIKDNHITFDELDRLIETAKANWVDGVCITGGEPTLQKKIVETAAFIKSSELALKLDTQGSFPDMLEKVIPHCDYIAMDYKAPVAKYKFITNVNIDPVKLRRSLDLLIHGDDPYEIRTTVVPGFHTEDDIHVICRELKGAKRFVLQNFIPRDNLPDISLREAQKTPLKTMETFAAICRDHFENVVVR